MIHWRDPLHILVSFAGMLAILPWKRPRSPQRDVVVAVLNAAVNAMDDGMLVVDSNSRIVDLNAVALRVLDCTAQDALGRPVEVVLTRWPELLDRYRRLAQNPLGDASVDEVVLLRQDQVVTDEDSTIRYYELHIKPLEGRLGESQGQLVILRDVSERERAERLSASQKKLIEDLIEVARSTVGSPTLRATLENALTVAAQLTAAECGTLFLLSKDGAVTHNLVVRGQKPLQRAREVIARLVEEGLAGWVMQHRQPVLIPDTHRDERWLHISDIPSALARSALTVPISDDAELLGILTLTHSQTAHFSIEHLNLMRVAAAQLALALRNAWMFDTERDMADRQTTLYQVLRAVAGQLSPDAVMEAAVEAISRFAGWSDVVIALPNAEQSHWVVRAAGGRLASVAGVQHQIDLGIIGRSLQTGQTQLVPEVRVDEDYISVGAGVKSELAVPLRRGERVLGVLDLQSEFADAFETHDVLLAELLAEAIALAMDNAWLYAETQQHVADLDALYTVTRMTGQSLAMEDVLTRALSSVLLSLGFDAGLINLTDVSDGRLHTVAEHGISSALSRRLHEEGLDGTLCAYVHSHRESVAISDLKKETSAELRSPASMMVAQGMRAYAGIPLLHRDSSLGTMDLFSRRRRNFATSEMSLLEAIGRQVATAVDNARLFQATVNERQRLLTLIESSRDGIILVGMDKRMLVVNAPALELLRLSGEPTEWTFQPLQVALDTIDEYAAQAVQDLTKEMSRVRRGDEPSGEGEFEIAPYAIRWLNLPVLADTTPLGRLLVFRDVTEERMLAKMRDDLTHTMVHDLRNPLTGISVALQLLDSKLADVISPAQHRLFEIAGESIQKMLQLINSILDLSQLEGGRMPVSPAPVSLGELIADTIRLQSPLCAARDLQLESDVPPDLPLVWADADLISRVLQNLIGNAVKFSPAGGRVCVLANRHDGSQVGDDGSESEGTSYLRVSVTDNGPGIPPELQSRLFQKFVVGAHKERGSGLGLAFCKLAVEAHGGRIWVESEPGKGTMVAFTLPASRESTVVETTEDLV